MRKLAVFVLGTVFFLNLGALPCLAIPFQIDPLVNFLRPVSAKVVTQVDSQVLIDKGSANQITPGDIFAVVMAAKKVRDPQSGETIDTLIKYGDFLVATRVKQNMTYCKRLGRKGSISPGSRVNRFENLPIFFEDATGNGFQLFARLRNALPQLLWHQYIAAPRSDLFAKGPGLLIRYTADKVAVLNQENQILFLQKATVPSRTAAAQPKTEEPSAPLATEARSDRLAASSNQGPKSEMRGESSAGFSKKWGVRRISLPVGGEIEAVRVADLDHDGQPEVILGIGGKLVVGHLKNGKLTELGQYSTQDWKQIVAISALKDPGDRGDAVVVSALNDGRPVSRVFKFAAGELRPITDSGMLLATFAPLSGKPFLLGVKGSDIFDFNPSLYKVWFTAGKVQKKPFDLQGARQPYGVIRLADAGGHPLTVSLAPANHLRVTDTKGQILWESGKTYGGSVKGIKIPQPGSRNTEDFKTLFLHAKLQRTLQGYVLVTEHEGPGLFANYPEYKNGRLVELSWNGFSLDVVKKSPSVGGMIVDFDQADLDQGGKRAIIAAVVYQQNGILQEAHSGLVILSPGK